MAENRHQGVMQPADDVILWIEQESSIHLKAVTRFGDPVGLSPDEARAVAQALNELAIRLEAL
ncbi:MAG TPA: hypothetical protein VKE74_21055 [Gemmataceae bacterium]|nr:hypothetical protein [Gemmataceae bacterium]